MSATQQGKMHALERLAHRRAHRPKLPDNSSLPAGSPMYFACDTCGAEIVVGEGYIERPRLCNECEALKAAGWLNE